MNKLVATFVLDLHSGRSTLWTDNLSDEEVLEIVHIYSEIFKNDEYDRLT